MPSDGIYFQLFPTAGAAMIGCIVLACVVFGLQVAWCLLVDDDKPPEDTIGRDDVSQAITAAKLRRIKHELDGSDHARD